MWVFQRAEFSNYRWAEPCCFFIAKNNLNLVGFKVEDFIPLSASPTVPTPRIFSFGKVTTEKSGCEISVICYLPQEKCGNTALISYIRKTRVTHGPPPHTHEPFCSIKTEVASSAQSMNWCENISLCMQKKLKRKTNSFRRFSTRVCISGRRLRPWRNKHTTWLFHIFLTLGEFNWLRKAQKQHSPWKQTL